MWEKNACSSIIWNEVLHPIGRQADEGAVTHSLAYMLPSSPAAREESLAQGLAHLQHTNTGLTGAYTHN